MVRIERSTQDPLIPSWYFCSIAAELQGWPMQVIANGPARMSLILQDCLPTIHGKLTLVLTSWKKSSKKSTYFLLLHRVGKDVSKSVSNITTSRFYLNWYSWSSYLWKWSKMPPKFVVFAVLEHKKRKFRTNPKNKMCLYSKTASLEG